ncbi:MAG: histidine kinase [Bacteroidales bacterium]|nr:histidine kinase [Bacteroidales bacterium]
MNKNAIGYIVLLFMLLIFRAEVSGQNNTLASYVLNKDISNKTESSSYLSSKIVTAIAQDENGMMWFGTKRGLNSFDSYNFEEYNQLDGIINATINDMLPCGDTLFIATEKGLCIYNIKKKQATNFFAETDSLMLPDNYIFHITPPVNNRITICTKSGTSVYDLATKEFYIPKINNYFPEYEVRQIEHIDDDNSWWLATSNGLVRYQDENQSIKHFYYIKDVKKTLPDNNLRCMYKMNNSKIFIGTANGLCLLDVENETVERIDLNMLTSYKSNKIDVSKIIAFNDDEVIVSTYTDGLYIYNHKNKTATHISKFNRRNAISDNNVFDVYKDTNGSIWVATYAGLDRFENNLANFSTVSLFQNGYILSINYFLEMNENDFLLGTEAGIKIFNINDESVKDFKTYFNSKEDYFESLYVYNLYLDNENRLWIGTRNDGLYIYDIESDEAVDVAEEYDIPNLTHAIVRGIESDKYGNMWVATNMGLCRINLKDKTHAFYNAEKRNKKSLPYNDLFDLMLVDDALYVTTGDGLAIYSYETNDFTRCYLPDSLMKGDVVKNNALFDIVDGGNGRYYIGSYSSGMLAFNPETKTFKTSKINGNYGIMVYAIIPDENGFLWASTSKGIVKYNLATKAVTSYDKSDGLQGNEFIPNAFLRSNNGVLFFGGFSGFNYFKPDDIKQENKLPEVVITKLQTSSGKKHRYLNHGDTIHLSYMENSFEISFATLNLLRNNMVKYSYMLDNYDNEWIVTNSAHRYADYNKLRPGTYRFKLKAANEVNVWTEKPLELTIVIHPAWYQRFIFKLMLVLLFSSVIFIIVKQRSRIIIQKIEQKRKINELEMQMAQLKQKTLQLQMNPHVIFNTLNSIQQYIIDHDIDKAVGYLSSFSKLMRRILNNSNERFVPLTDEMEAVRLYLELESMRLGNRFNFEINIDPDLDADNIEVAPLIIQPFVENAIIHGLVPKKENCVLKISLSKIADEKLLCIIEDNGVGRKYSEKIKQKSGSHKSYGMSITRRRLEMLSKISNDDFSVDVVDLQNDNGESLGTQVRIVISYHD